MPREVIMAEIKVEFSIFNVWLSHFSNTLFIDWSRDKLLSLIQYVWLLRYDKKVGK